MADHEQESNQESLTKHEREASRILAKEIARETGLQRDPEEAARRDGLKTRVDVNKHVSTLARASAVRVVALQNQLHVSSCAILTGLVCIGMSFLVSLLSLGIFSDGLAKSFLPLFTQLPRGSVLGSTRSRGPTCMGVPSRGLLPLGITSTSS